MPDHECVRCPECDSCPACAADALDCEAVEIDRLRLALETATREAEEERRTAEAAVKFLGRIAEVTWEAGLPSGDREQTLKNVRALASRPAPPSDAARRAGRMLRHLCNVYGCTSYGRKPDHGPEDCSWCEAEALLDALSSPAPAPAPSAPAKEKP